ncbi:MAG: hypothetical protein WCC17_18755 [Candidatus Nitrosopolaris sp.]
MAVSKNFRIDNKDILTATEEAKLHVGTFNDKVVTCPWHGEEWMLLQIR